MSDFRAIAAVSRTLKNVLDALMEMRSTVTVTIAPPDVTLSEVSGNRLNLYAYQVVENGHLKNLESTCHGYREANSQPPLCLDMHYLMTAYPENEIVPDADLVAQEILGDAMQVLHEQAIVPPNLLDPGLVDACEELKITLQPVSLEDFSKLWTALPEAKFRRSAAYHVSVIQIERRGPVRIAQPVETRRIHMSLTKRPQIETVYRTPALPNEPVGDIRAQIGQELTIKGQNFSATRIWVKLGDLEPIRIRPVSNTEIKIVIPDRQYPVDAEHPVPRDIPNDLLLVAGPQRIEVSTEQATEVVEGGLDKGQVGTDHGVVRSNQAVFMLIPQITSIEPVSGPAVPTILTVTGVRLYRSNLKSYVIVGDVAIEVRPPEPGDGWEVPTDTMVQVPLVALSTVRPNVYGIRVMVNGAQNFQTDMLFELTNS